MPENRLKSERSWGEIAEEVATETDSEKIAELSEKIDLTRWTGKRVFTLWSWLGPQVCKAGPYIAQSLRRFFWSHSGI